MIKEILKEVNETLSGGSKECIKLLYGQAKALLEIHALPKEVIRLLTLETLNSLLAGTSEAVKAFYAFYSSSQAGAEAPSLLIKNIAQEVRLSFVSAAKKGGESLYHIANALVDIENIPLEFFEIIAKETVDSIATGHAENKKLGAHLADDMPDAFYIHISYPLEYWWEPKKKALSKRLQEIKIASQKRLEALQKSISAKIDEIQKKIEIVIGGISRN